MKRLLLLLLLAPTIAFSQKDEEVLTNYKQYGYVGGIRMDSLNGTYAQTQITGIAAIAGNAIKRFTFEYGQVWRNEKDIRVTDASGKVLTFNSNAAALDFFEYNGWKLVQLYYGVGNGGQSMLLRKIDR